MNDSQLGICHFSGLMARYRVVTVKVLILLLPVRYLFDKVRTSTTDIRSVFR